MSLAELQIEHLVGLIIVPVLLMWVKDMVKAVVKSVTWKYSSHLNKGDLILLKGEEATIVRVNFSGLHVNYKETGNQRVISVSKLDSLDVRKISPK